MSSRTAPPRIEDGSVIAIIGAGPAGSFFSLIALKEAEARGMRIRPILFDGKSFLQEGPKGCNMCAGVISWNLVQQIEQLGLQIPPDRVQRMIKSYVFHTREGSHAVISPPGRGPLPVVFRGNGPRLSEEIKKISFDDYLLEQALARGAESIPSHIESFSFARNPAECPTISWPGGELKPDLVVLASGVMSKFARQLADSGMDYQFPRCVRAYQAELDLGESAVEEFLGNSIHVFSLGIKDVRFAAIIPKTRFATVSLVGNRDLTHEHLEALLEMPTVQQLLPPGWHQPNHYCSCRPRLPIRGAKRFFGNRYLFVGDASMSRYYKNGIDSAFRTARYAVQAVFDHGLSSRELKKSYHFFMHKEFKKENAYARLLFRLNDFVATKRFWIRAHLYFVFKRPGGHTAQILHFLTWNLFTGDSSYRDIFLTSLNPRFLSKIFLAGARFLLPLPVSRNRELTPLEPAILSVRPQPLGPLVNGKTVVIVGGGPGGTSCGIALKRIAKQRGIELRVVLYEGKDFKNKHQHNQCAGVLSPPIEELMKRDLGVSIPDSLVQRIIHSYRLCNGKQDLVLTSSTHRSYALRRSQWDQFMIEQAGLHGVEVMDCRVTNLESIPDGVLVYGENGTMKADVIVGAFGLDPGTASIFEKWISYRIPKSLETIVTKIHPGEEWMGRFKEDIFAFLPRLHGISFGAITPKRNHLTINISGARLTTADMQKFLSLPEVRKWLPPDYDPGNVAEECHKGLFPNCPAKVFSADRFVAVGDTAGLVRPFKGKGITSACLTGIAAAKVMMDFGISRKAFLAYRHACRAILSDRYYGWGMQKLAALFRFTGSVDALLQQARGDAGLRRVLFLSVSGEESFRSIFQEGFQVSRALRILKEILKQKLSRSGDL